MKKLILALILAVVLSLTVATPVLAGDPPKKMPDGSMPEDGEAGLETAKHNIQRHPNQGWYYGWSVINWHLLQGYIPRSPYSPQH